MSTWILLLILLSIPVPLPAQEGPGTWDDPQSPRRLMGPRREPERSRTLRRHGGSRATEKAVRAGLDWLVRHQDPGGSWDADGFSARCPGSQEKCSGRGKGQHGEEVPCPFDHAITGLAALAFLGHGHRVGDQADEYGPVLERALRFLRGGGDRWGFVIATQVLAEAEGLERKGRFLDEVKRRSRQLLAWQGDDGAWGYATGWGRGADVPFTALVVQALVAARDVGVEFPETLPARVEGFLSSLEVKRGRLAYLKDGRRFGYTPTSENAACAAAIRSLLQVGTRSKRHRQHLDLLARQRPNWKLSFEELVVPGRGKQRVQVGHLSMYRWWYGTLATFQAGGATWAGWNGRLKQALLKHQVRQSCARGSWSPEGLYERQTGGRVFATALGVLMLEQPYRQRRLRD